MITVDIDAGNATATLEQAAQRLENAAPLMQIIAATLETQTEMNFWVEGRPHWVPLADSTKKERLKRNRGSSTLKILQDSGILAASVSTSYGEDFAQIGAGGAAAAYAAIHQFGGEIQRSPYSSWVRLRTDRKGNLLRQTKNKNLAVFAKDSHKQAAERRYTSDGYTISIPARPYLPFTGPPGGAQLQPDAESSIMENVIRYMQASFPA